MIAASFGLDISLETELNEALSQLTLDMCHITEGIEEVPQYIVREDVDFYSKPLWKA